MVHIVEIQQCKYKEGKPGAELVDVNMDFIAWFKVIKGIPIGEKKPKWYINIQFKDGSTMQTVRYKTEKKVEAERQRLKAEVFLQNNK